MNAFIKKIRLLNFKCYDHLDLELSSGVNIVYGTNGTGKTTILEALAVAAGSFFIKLPEVEKNDISKKHVRIATQNQQIAYQFPVELEAEGCVLGDDIVWKRSLNSIEGRTTSIDASQMVAISDKAAKEVQNFSDSSLPLIAYFSTQRLFVERRESEKRPLGRLAGYYNSLNSTNIRKYIQTWFKDAEFTQYQRRLSDPDYTNPILEGLKALILRHFDEFERLYYYEYATDMRLDHGLFFVRKDHAILPESFLSDGYRNFMWLLLEIAWRCTTLNPFWGGEAFERTTGIVLIDEIDLHLHPKWQQRIVEVLVDSFPKLQFVLTTHSPIILSSVKANVLRLTDDGIYPQKNLYGMKPEQVLEMVMGITARLPKHQEMITRYFELIKQGNGEEEEAKQLRRDLETNIGHSDPIFSGADSLIYLIKL